MPEFLDGFTLAAFDVFTPTGYYDGAYEWPSAVKLNDDEREETNALFSDLNTYFEENYVQFVDGTKPMTDLQNGAPRKSESARADAFKNEM